MHVTKSSKREVESEKRDENKKYTMHCITAILNGNRMTEPLTIPILKMKNTRTKRLATKILGIFTRRIVDTHTYLS